MVVPESQAEGDLGTHTWRDWGVLFSAFPYKMVNEKNGQ